ncbi:hypothetical protein GJAV_G00108440 [Gymnothorax javanicus]|nr:hypothetical protein GJAV_G00108440 [Gymnothorax javanicus]
MFSDVVHDMEMTDAITGRIQENQGPSSKRRETTSSSSQKSNLLCAASTNANDMDMTRSQVVFIDSENCPLNPTSSVERRTSCQSPPNKTIVFSDAPHDMDMTNAFTGRILQNADICTGGNKTPDRPTIHDKTTECNRAWEASSSDSNDMELTRSQTVVLDSKRCGTAKASLSAARKSISLILPSSKARVFPAGLCGIQVPKAPVGSDIDCNKLPSSGWGMAAMLSSTTNDVSSSVEPEVMGKSTEQEATGDPNDMEIRNESLLECQDVGRQNRLPLGETRNVHCESVCNKTQISSCEDYAVEMIETPVRLSVKCGLPPTGGDEAEIAFRIQEANSTGVCVQVASPGSSCTWGVVSSGGAENEKIQRVCVHTRDEDMVTSSTSAMSETSFPASSKAQFSSETHYDMAADHNVSACTDGVGSQVSSSPAPEFVPPPCLPSCETVAEGTTLRPTDLTVLGEMSDNAPLVNSVVPLNEGRPDTTDNSEYSLATDSSRIDHGGKQTDKRAKSRRMSLADLQSKLQDIGHMITEKFEPMAYPSTAPIPPLTVPSSLRDEDAACLPMVKPDSDDHSNDVNPCMTPDHLKFDGQANRTETLTLSKSKPWTSRLSLASFQPKLPRRSKPPSLNQEGSTRKGEATVRLRESEFCVAERDCDGSEVKNIDEETLPEISSEEDLSGTVEVGIFRDREQEVVPSLPAADVDADGRFRMLHKA